jgi:hypothetical protein
VPQGTKLTRLYELALQPPKAAGQTVKPDDHSEVVPLLPIPNRTVKRLCADDSAGSRVKVGHRQAVSSRRPVGNDGAFSSVLRICVTQASIDESAMSVLECESSLTALADRQVVARRPQSLTGLLKISHNRGLR